MRFVVSNVGIPPKALCGTIKKSKSLIERPTFFVICGACDNPIRIQGKNVGVMYSAEHLLSTILLVISMLLKAGACAQGILNSFEI